MHPRTDLRRNSGRREPADSATEMSASAGVSNGAVLREQYRQVAKHYDDRLPMDESHRRWCNGELRASPAESEGFG